MANFEFTMDGTTTYVTTVESPFHTGQTVGRHRRSRIRHCPRSGLPGYADDFIEDGYNEGLRVSADWWDPREPDPPTPSDNEGEITDEAT